MDKDYSDIIDLPHHQSTKRPRMSLADRAAQFSPFAALSGYEAAVRETERLTDRQIDLDGDEIAALDEKIRVLIDQIDQHPEVSITYFQPDSRKDGGAYVTVAGQIKKIDSIERTIIFSDRRTISIDTILDIQSSVFHSSEWGMSIGP